MTPKSAPSDEEEGGPTLSPDGERSRGERIDAEPGDRVWGRPVLGPQEELLVVLRGIGASMFLTSRRLIVARDGAERRPRSGLQSFPLEAIQHLRIEMGSAPSGRVVVWTGGGQEALSMFFQTRSLDRAQKLLDIARPLIARSRREPMG